MTTGAEAELVAVIRARDQASGVLKQVNASVKGLDDKFRNLTRVVGIFGLGTLSLGVALRSVITTSETLKRTQALAQAQLEAWGPGTQKAFEELKPHLEGIGDKFGFTARDVEKAAADITDAAHGTVPSVEDVETAMGLARVSGESLEGAAKKVGAALLGNIEPIRENVKGVDSLEEATRIFIPKGEAATSEWQKQGRTLRASLEHLAAWTSKLFELNRALGELILKAAKEIVATLKFIQNWETVPPWVEQTLRLGTRLVDATVRFFASWHLPDWVEQTIRLGTRLIDATVRFFASIPGWLKDLLELGERAARIIIHFDYRGLIPGIIPGFAHGGIVTRPTLAMVGESGPEAIVPLSRGGAAAGAAGGVTVNINFGGNLIVDDPIRQRELARTIQHLIEQNLRRGGRF